LILTFGAYNRHQLEALTMMVEKEAGIHDERAQFPTIWEPYTSQSGMTRYRNIVTEQFELSDDVMPPPVGGGIIADVIDSQGYSRVFG
jgi:hypothetical protein